MKPPPPSCPRERVKRTLLEIRKQRRKAPFSTPCLHALPAFSYTKRLLTVVIFFFLIYSLILYLFKGPFDDLFSKRACCWGYLLLGRFLSLNLGIFDNKSSSTHWGYKTLLRYTHLRKTKPSLSDMRTQLPPDHVGAAYTRENWRASASIGVCAHSTYLCMSQSRRPAPRNRFANRTGQRLK